MRKPQTMATRQRQRRRPGHGFTLIELLVVISIISLLISILLPTLRNMRSSALVAACSSNQRGFGIAMAAYSNDHRDALPHTGIGNDWAFEPPTWRQNLVPYLGSKTVDLSDFNTPDEMSFACPANPVGSEDHPNLVQPNHALIRGTRLSYVANGRYDAIGGGVKPAITRFWTDDTLPNGQPSERTFITRRFSDYRRPSATILIHEGGYSLEPGTGLIMLDAHNVRHVPDRWWFVHPGVGLATFGYVDGHVKAMPLPQSLEPSHWDINGLPRVTATTRESFEFLQQWHQSR